MKASLVEDEHTDSQLDWIEELILDVNNLMDAACPLNDIIFYLKENDVTNDMMFLIVSAAKVYRS